MCTGVCVSLYNLTLCLCVHFETCVGLCMWPEFWEGILIVGGSIFIKELCVVVVVGCFFDGGAKMHSEGFYPVALMGHEIEELALYRQLHAHFWS